MSRATLGVHPSTPVAFLQAEGGSIPAVARLARRQGAFPMRLAMTRNTQQHDIIWGQREVSEGPERRVRPGSGYGREE